MQTPEEREYSALVQTALESAVLLDSFPKATLDVYVCVLEAGGGEVPAAICAASLALAHAGIAMRDLVAACAVVCIGPCTLPLLLLTGSSLMMAVSRAHLLTRVPPIEVQCSRFLQQSVDR